MTPSLQFRLVSEAAKEGLHAYVTAEIRSAKAQHARERITVIGKDEEEMEEEEDVQEGPFIPSSVRDNSLLLGLQSMIPYNFKSTVREETFEKADKLWTGHDLENLTYKVASCPSLFLCCKTCPIIVEPN